MFILLENHNDLLIYSKVIVSSCTSPNYNPPKKKKKSCNWLELDHIYFWFILKMNN